MVTVVVGPTGSGKSTFLARMLQHLQHSQKLIVIVDDSKFYTQYLPNLLVIPLRSESEQYDKLNLDKILRTSAQKDKPVLFESSEMQTSDIQKFLDKLGSLLLTRYKNIILVVEEAYRLFPRYKFSKAIAQLMRSGRKRGISIYLVFQQFRDVDPAGVREATWGIGFKPQGPSEIENFQKTFDFYNVQTLGAHSYVIKNFRTGELEINTLKMDS